MAHRYVFYLHVSFQKIPLLRTIGRLLSEKNSNALNTTKANISWQFHQFGKNLCTGKKLPVQNMTANKRPRPVLMKQKQTFQSALSKRKATFLHPELITSLGSLGRVHGSRRLAAIHSGWPLGTPPSHTHPSQLSSCLSRVGCIVP